LKPSNSSFFSLYKLHPLNPKPAHLDAVHRLDACYSPDARAPGKFEE
jgi:hypothetical protein